MRSILTTHLQFCSSANRYHCDCAHCSSGELQHSHHDKHSLCSLSDSMLSDAADRRELLIVICSDKIPYLNRCLNITNGTMPTGTCTVPGHHMPMNDECSVTERTAVHAAFLTKSSGRDELARKL